jgi:hypothetical protein
MTGWDSRPGLCMPIELCLSQGRPPGKAAVRAAVATLVPRENLEQFTELAFADLRNLHEGNVSRYRLRPTEYHAWQPMQQPGIR